MTVVATTLEPQKAFIAAPMLSLRKRSAPKLFGRLHSELSGFSAQRAPIFAAASETFRTDVFLIFSFLIGFHRCEVFFWCVLIDH